MNQKDLIRQATMLCLLTLAAVLGHYSAVGEPSQTIVRTLFVGSWVTLGMAALLCLRALAFGKPRVKNLPSISVKSVVIYVYGLGLLVYVSIYCLLDLSMARNFYLIALAGISVDDIIERSHDSPPRKALIAICAACSLGAFIVKGMLSPDRDEVIRALADGRVYVFFFGFALPALAPIVYLAIRSRRLYTPITVMEFMHIAMPFAVHASVSTLLSLSLISTDASFDLNSTETTHFDLNATLTPHFDLNATVAMPNATQIAESIQQTARLVTSADVATPLLALVMIPVIFFAIQTTLLYSIADFLAPAAIVAGFRHAAEAPSAEPWTVFVVLAGSAAFFCRVYVCIRDCDDRAGVLYSSEVDLDEDKDDPPGPEVLRRLQEVAVYELDDAEV